MARNGKELASKADARVYGDDDTLYTCEEIEFMLAMDRYKRDKRRPYPTWSEVLGVLVKLGYQKVKEDQ